MFKRKIYIHMHTTILKHRTRCSQVMQLGYKCMQHLQLHLEHMATQMYTGSAHAAKSIKVYNWMLTQICYNKTGLKANNSDSYYCNCEIPFCIFCAIIRICDIWVKSTFMLLNNLTRTYVSRSFNLKSHVTRIIMLSETVCIFVSTTHIKWGCLTYEEGKEDSSQFILFFSSLFNNAVSSSDYVCVCVCVCIYIYIYIYV
jgi:hypothetical protein